MWSLGRADPYPDSRDMRHCNDDEIDIHLVNEILGER